MNHVRAQGKTSVAEITRPEKHVLDLARIFEKVNRDNALTTGSRNSFGHKEFEQCRATGLASS